MHSIVLKPGKEQSIKRFHPWIFSGAVMKKPDGLSGGESVRIISSLGEVLGTGHYQEGSIAVRMLSFSEAEHNDEFWKIKIRNALQLRLDIGLAGNEDTNAYRLVNAEGDGLPGLIIDWYNGTAVVQAHTPGMHMVLNQLVVALKSVMGKQLRAVYYRGFKSQYEKNTLQKRKQTQGDEPGGGNDPEEKHNRTDSLHQPGYLLGGPVDNVIRENGNLFEVDWAGGQKTGFFLDQRENRRLAGLFSNNKTVLNMFGYTGGFSIYALQGGAKEVVTVDSSPDAVEMSAKNAGINFGVPGNHKPVCADVFDFFRENKESYDLVILDPPAFAKGLRAVKNALQAYRRVNMKALERVDKGGMLFTFSCSQVVSKEQFRQAVYSAALGSGREIRILHQLTQPADHPVSIYHPEGEYLKGLVLQVE